MLPLLDLYGTVSPAIVIRSFKKVSSFTRFKLQKYFKLNFVAEKCYRICKKGYYSLSNCMYLAIYTSLQFGNFTLLTYIALFLDVMVKHKMSYDSSNLEIRKAIYKTHFHRSGHKSVFCYLTKIICCLYSLLGTVKSCRCWQNLGFQQHKYSACVI